MLVELLDGNDRNESKTMNQKEHAYAETIKLSNDVEKPMEGVDVFQLPEANVGEQAVGDALSVCDHFIDIAAAYFNEEAVGATIKKERDSP